MESIESEIHQILVKFLDGKHKAINFTTPSIPISALKHRIETLTSIPSQFQLLISNNSRILHDHQILTLESSIGHDGPENIDLLAQKTDSIRSNWPGKLNLEARNPEVSIGHNGPENPGQLTRKTVSIGSNGPEIVNLEARKPEISIGPYGPETRAQVNEGKFPMVVHLLLRLRGGKGGFGSLLRGAATKAGQKKTNNFDACRDMSGRRLRHVNAEKRLEEWRAEAEERKLEKMAEEYLKKNAKEAAKKGKSSKGENIDKYIKKYQEDSEKCMEEVERSVRESLKRKDGLKGGESDSKRLKIWFGKRRMDDSDSEDDDDSDSDSDSDSEKDEKEKSVVIDNGNHSDSSKEAEGSSGSITGGKSDIGPLGRDSSSSGSEEETEKSRQSSKSPDDFSADGQGKQDENRSPQEVLNGHRGEAVDIEKDLHKASESAKVEETVGEQPVVSGAEEEGASHVTDTDLVLEESVSACGKTADLDKPLSFDDFNSAAELEVLGLERLKLELQARGLKCGGTLQERAARLFLLKTTPLKKLPKKLFAKK